jgi:hypothetical protein
MRKALTVLLLALTVSIVPMGPGCPDKPGVCPF